MESAAGDQMRGTDDGGEIIWSDVPLVDSDLQSILKWKWVGERVGCQNTVTSRVLARPCVVVFNVNSSVQSKDVPSRLYRTSVWTFSASCLFYGG